MNDNPHGQQFPRQQIYSQADMDAAKTTARADGYAAGYADGLKSAQMPVYPFGGQPPVGYRHSATTTGYSIPPGSKKGGAECE